MKTSATLRILMRGEPQKSFPKLFECKDVPEGGLGLACTGNGGSLRAYSVEAPRCLCSETSHIQPSSRAPAWCNPARARSMPLSHQQPSGPGD